MNIKFSTLLKAAWLHQEAYKLRKRTALRLKAKWYHLPLFWLGLSGLAFQIIEKQAPLTDDEHDQSMGESVQCVETWLNLRCKHE